VKHPSWHSFSEQLCRQGPKNLLQCEASPMTDAPRPLTHPISSTMVPVASEPIAVTASAVAGMPRALTMDDVSLVPILPRV